METPLKAMGLDNGEWTEHADSDSGKKYYHNNRTRKSFWEGEPPPGEDDEATGAGNPVENGTTLNHEESGDEWTEHEDPDSGKKFYYNKRTRKSIWEGDAPAHDEEEGRAMSGHESNEVDAGGDEDDEWTEHKDEGTGKKFYYNKRTRKSIWEGNMPAKEGGHEEGAAEAQIAGHSEPEETGDGDGEDWTEHECPDTGKKFYHNKRTRKSIWEGEKTADDGGGGAETGEFLENTAVEEGATTAGEGSEGEWTEHEDPGSGKKFYHNKRTRKSIWVGEDEEVKSRTGSDSSTGKTLTMSVVTWNVGNAMPAEEDMDQLLIPEYEEAPDIVVLGVQECRYTTKSNGGKRESETSKGRGNSGLGSKGPRRSIHSNHFLDLCLASLSKLWGVEASSANVVATISLMEMRLYIFCKQSLKKEVHDVEKGMEATGIAHVIGNKGGLAIKIEIFGKSLCFLSCHLAAHLKHLDDRVSNLHEIFHQLRLGVKKLELTHQFDHMFLIGDLNFRVDLSTYDPEKYGFIDHAHHVNAVKELVANSDWDALMSCDQLKQIQRQRVPPTACELHGFQEGVYDFAPTFKVERASGTEYIEKRVPSYCDRILWKSMPGAEKDLEQVMLESLPGVSSSDHKPVRSIFRMDVSHQPEFMEHDASRAEEDALVVVLSDLRATSLKSYDTNGLSDPYIVFHMLPSIATIGCGNEDKVIKQTRLRSGTFKKKVDKRNHSMLKHHHFKQETYKTSIQKKTLDPVWGSEHITIQTRVSDPNVLRKCHVALICYDYDQYGYHDKIGTSVLSLLDQDGETMVSKRPVPFQLPITKKGRREIGENGKVSYLSGKIAIERTSAYFRRVSKDRTGEVECQVGHNLHGWSEMSGNLPATLGSVLAMKTMKQRSHSFGSGIVGLNRPRGYSRQKSMGDAAEVPHSPIQPTEKGFNRFQEKVKCLDLIQVKGEPPQYGGTLLKQGSGKGFMGSTKYKPRYFVIEQHSDNAVVKYFSSADAFLKTGKTTKRSRPIELSHYNFRDVGCDYEFRLEQHLSGNGVDPDNREYTFRARNEEEKVAWKAVLRRWC
jgi:hypothetical protein